MSREALIQNPPFHLTPVDIATLRQTDEEWVPYTWDFLKGVIERNELYALSRLPSELENYIHFNYHVKSTYGSMMNFLLQHKIKWVPATIAVSEIDNYLPLKPSDPVPFASPDDYRIVRNDWPYGQVPEIQHLVVWLKGRIPVDEEGDPTQESRRLIKQFVNKIFKSKLGDGAELMWFRNRTQWQSVRALEHIHILMRGSISEELLEQWTGQKVEDMERTKWKNGKKIAD